MRLSKLSLAVLGLVALFVGCNVVNVSPPPSNENTSDGPAPVVPTENSNTGVDEPSDPDDSSEDLESAYYVLTTSLESLSARSSKADAEIRREFKWQKLGPEDLAALTPEELRLTTLEPFSKDEQPILNLAEEDLIEKASESPIELTPEEQQRLKDSHFLVWQNEEKEASEQDSRVGSEGSYKIRPVDEITPDEIRALASEDAPVLNNKGAPIEKDTLVELQNEIETLQLENERLKEKLSELAEQVDERPTEESPQEEQLVDQDLDGISDRKDLCPGTLPDNDVNRVGCAAYQRDGDGDGVTDDLDECPATFLRGQVDSRGCIETVVDSDADGIADERDNCPELANADQLDGNRDGVGDACDCDGNGQRDEDQMAQSPARDCDGNGTLDLCEGWWNCETRIVPACPEADVDCSGEVNDDDIDLIQLSANWHRDMCEASVHKADVDRSGYVDDKDIEAVLASACYEETIVDCDLNGKDDNEEVASGEATDCDGSGILDRCETWMECAESASLACPSADVNCDGRIDGLDLAVVRSSANMNKKVCEAASYRADVNRDGAVSMLDSLQIESAKCWGVVLDCNGNRIEDELDLANKTSEDCNENRVPDECESWGECDSPSLAGCPNADVNCDHVVNGLDTDLIRDAGNWGQVACKADNPRADVDLNGIINGLDVAVARSSACWDVETDCNTNELDDAAEILAGTSEDCDLDGVPDDCQISADALVDCNSNGLLDSCERACESTSVCPDMDVNCDNVVNGLDRAIIQSSANWGKSACAADDLRADVDGNGFINGLDIMRVTSGSCWGM